MPSFSDLFTGPPLARENLCPDPLAQFHAWFDVVYKDHGELATAMTLATYSEKSGPSARVVLLKRSDQQGFVFFTNYDSNKANELEITGKSCLVFYWPWVGQQIRIWGEVTRLPANDSDEYFRSRPRESQLGAWASPQSNTIATRDELDRTYREIEEKFANNEVVSRPANWGGYLVAPKRYEFWHGQPHRLHDRFLYTMSEGRWEICRLAP